ncbi:MAG: hemolysin family protein [Ignavibacteria bacterium]|jgi:CBS domain containing-hemolysin-like protein|nr:hemolysin family protein [Ignavibacteria bacterium]
MINDVLILLTLILFSAWFSATELAYVLTNKIKNEIELRKNNISAKSADYFINRPQDFFSTILIGNNIANIAFASISAYLLHKLFAMEEWQILITSTLILLIFAELIPKYLASQAADILFPISSLFLRVLHFILYPLVKITSSISKLFTGSRTLHEENYSLLFSRDDIGELVRESQEAGFVDKKDSSIINNVLEFREQRIYEALTPRTEIVGVEIDAKLEDIIDVFVESGYSKLPVYEENLDNIKGMVLAYDVFKLPGSLREIIRDVIYVPETKKSFEMLNDFLSKGVSIAIVVDEFGGTAGIVTMEDIIEELFGEIKDEYDVDENICRKISDKDYLLSGKTEIDQINEQLHLKIETGDYETLAGFIFAKIGRIPGQGESINISNYKLLIIKSTQTKIELIKLTLLEEFEV